MLLAPAPAAPGSAARRSGLVPVSGVAARLGSRGVWSRVAPHLTYVALAVLLLRGAWVHLGSRYPGLQGDPKLFIWYLGWLPWAVLHGHDPLLTSYLRAPWGANLMWNTSVPLAAALLAPVTLLFGPVVSYTVLLTGCFALSASACYVCALALVRRRTLAWFAGLLYGFSEYELGHGLGHPNLALATTPPLFLWVVVRLVTGRVRPRRAGIQLGLLAVGQLLLGEEILLDTALATVVLSLAVGVVHRRRCAPLVRPLATAAGVAAGVVLVLAAAPIAVQFFGPDRLAPLAGASGVSGNDLASFVAPTSLLADPAFGDLLSTPPGSLLETTAYLGVLPIVAIGGWVATATGAAFRRRRAAPAPAVGAGVRLLGPLVLTGISCAVLSLGGIVQFRGRVVYRGLTPWGLLAAHVPLFRDALPGRLSLFVDLAFVLAAAIVLDQLLDAGGRRRDHSSRLPRLFAFGLGGLVALTWMPSVDFPARPVSVPPFFSSAAVRALPRGCTVLANPLPYSTQSDEAMLWQVTSNFRFRLVDGYVLGPLLPGQQSVFSPEPLPAVKFLQDAAATSPGEGVVTLPVVRADLRSLGVCAIVAAPPPGAAFQESVDRLTGVRPLDSAGVEVWLLTRPVESAVAAPTTSLAPRRK